MANEVGILSPNLDADDIPSRLPDGIVSFLSGAAVGSFDVEPYIEMKVCLGRSKVHCLLTPAIARDMIGALQGAIAESEELAETTEVEVDAAEAANEDGPVSHETVLGDIRASTPGSANTDPFLKALGNIPYTTRPARA